MRSFVVALLILLQAGAALAGPFDTYQLIMWQERTPTQIDGLKRLGFTATKLRATSGEIDPADLAAHIASGLPWYLENIATDFYSPYHRYTRGKSVTWLFDEAKARYRHDPADPSVFVREPSLSDPEWRQRIAERLQRVTAAQSRYDPLFYNLADEAGIGDLAAAWDADLFPASLAGMREWLQTQYPSLDALNAEWGTAFPSWDAVQPMLTDEALRRDDSNYAAWADFKAWMDVSFARAVRFGTDALHRAAPTALAGLEGGQLPGWGGYDYFQLAPAVDVFEIYDEANNVAIAHAANPSAILLRTSFGPGDGAEAWRNMLQGGRGTIVWDEGDTVVRPDGSPAPRGVELARTVAAIRAVAPVIQSSTEDRDPVAVLVSQSSFRLQWLLDRRTGAPWADRSAGREFEDNAWRASRRETLQRLSALGIQPHLISTAMLEGGALNRDGIKVVFLPHVLSLSDSELAALRRFVAAGGTILADTEPGLFDGHLRRRDQMPLMDIARVSEAIMRRGGAPTAELLDGLASILTPLGAGPRATFRAPDGTRVTGIEARWFRRGDTRILSLQATAPYSAPGRISVGLERPATIRDLRGGALIAPPFLITLDPADPSILEVTCR